LTPLRILVFVDYYLPGYKGGGPVRSVSRIVEKLSYELDFWIFTRDRDLGDSEPYANVEINRWRRQEMAHHFYASPDRLGARSILETIRAANPNVIYLNSYFSNLTRAVLLLRAFGFLKGTAIIVAPRGEFSAGALQLKAAKKRAFLRIASAAGLHRKVTWQVSTVHEQKDTIAAVGTESRCCVGAPHVEFPSSTAGLKPPKDPGKARFAFISRISPKKNLLGALEFLKDVRGEVDFTIFGPAEDQDYLRRCQDAAAALPLNIRCTFAGPIPQPEVSKALAEHDFFLFPTLGENFGHVIAEALGAGCPALLSDQTPWLDLETKGCGWVVALEDAESWRSAIQACIDMGDADFQAMSEAARDYIRGMAEASSDPEPTRRLFWDAYTGLTAKAA